MTSSKNDSEMAIDPALAQGAQIPLQSFQLPDFPSEAQGLRALTLTCDIKTDEYFELLKTSLPAIPSLPRSITSLTLELFSLGYPAGFLVALAKELPNIKELVVYSQLLGGVTSESQEDAIQSFLEWKELRSLHLLDVFGKPHFFQKIGEALRKKDKGLMFLEINYTFRHEDEDFLTRVPAVELPLLISSSLVTCAMNIAAPEESEDDQDPSNLTKAGEVVSGTKDGIMAFNKTLSPDLVGELTEAHRPEELKLLNITLYTVDVLQLKSILGKHKRLALLNATVLCEPNEEWKQKLLDALAVCPELEQVEIVGNPSLEFAMLMSNPKRQADTISKAFPSGTDIERLSLSCPTLINLSANILRTTATSKASWVKNGQSWEGGIVTTTIPDHSDGRHFTADAQVATSA